YHLCRAPRVTTPGGNMRACVDVPVQKTRVLGLGRICGGIRDAVPHVKNRPAELIFRSGLGRIPETIKQYPDQSTVGGWKRIERQLGGGDPTALDRGTRGRLLLG